MGSTTTTLGIRVETEGTQAAARDIAAVDNEVRELAKTPAQADRHFDELRRKVEALTNAARRGSLAPCAAEIKAIGSACGLSERHVKSMLDSMSRIKQAQAFNELRREAGLSTAQLARMQAAAGDMRGAMAALGSGIAAARLHILAFTAATGLAAEACLDAALQADRLDKAYATIYGSAAGAERQLAFLYETGNRLGLQFQSTAEAAKTFFSAGKGTALEAEMNNIFTAVSSAGAALSLSTDQMQGAFMALGQMISKGKVQAEELRGQLGERLPGAFQLAAKAMGMTTAELDKFMADGKLTADVLLPKLARVLIQDFGAAGEKAAQGLQGQLNRLSTEWERLKAGFVDSEAMAAGIGDLSGLMKGLADNSGYILDTLGDAAKWGAIVGGIALVVKGYNALSAAIKAAQTAAAGGALFANLASKAMALTAALGTGGLVAVVGAITLGLAALANAGESADEVFARHRGTIEAYKNKLAEAGKAVEDFTQKQIESRKKQLEFEKDALQGDIGKALKGMKVDAGIDWNIQETGGFWQQLHKANEELQALGKNLSQRDLDAWRDKLLALNDQVKANNLSSDNWNNALKALILTGDSFYTKLSALIQQGYSLDEALQKLGQTAATTKAELASGWTIDVAGVTKGIAAMEGKIRSMRAEMLGGKDLERMADIFPTMPLADLEKARTIYKDVAALAPSFREFALHTKLTKLGDGYNNMGTEAQNALHTALSANAELGKTQAEYNAYQRQLQKDLKDSSGGAAKAAIDYGKEIKNTQRSIEALDAQIATADLDVFSRESILIAEKYENTLEDITDKYKDQLASAKGVALQEAETLKKLEETEARRQRDVDLLHARDREEQRQAQNLQTQAQFYQQLAELSGDYGLSIEWQNILIEEQAKLWKKAEIPDEYIKKMKELLRLQNSNNWADGVIRGLKKYAAEAGDVAKGMESAFLGLFQGIDSSMRSMWATFIDTGKLKLSNFKDLFNNFLAELMHMAITRPIMVEIAGSISSAFGLGDGSGSGGLAQAAGGLLKGALSWIFGNPSSPTDTADGAVAAITESLASGGDGMYSGGAVSLFGGDKTGSVFSLAGKLLNPSTWTSAWETVSAGYNYVVDIAKTGFNYIGSLIGSGSTGASTAATSAAASTASSAATSTATSAATSTATTTLSTATTALTAAMSVAGTVFASIGAGFSGYQMGSYAASKMIGNDKMGTVGADDGSKVGALIGGVSAFALAMAFATAGSVVPVIGTFIGAAVGAIAGALLGAGTVRKPTMWTGVNGSLGWEEGMEGGPLAGKDFSDLDVLAEHFGPNFAQFERERPGSRTFWRNNDYYTVGTSGWHLGGGTDSDKMRKMIDDMGAMYFEAMHAANRWSLGSGDIMDALSTRKTVLNDDYSLNQTPADSYGYGEQWLAQLRNQHIVFAMQQKGSRVSQKGIDKMLEGLTKEIEEAFQVSFAALDLSAISDRFTVDQSSYEGLQKFLEAIVVTQDVMARTEMMYQATPVTEVQEQVAEVFKTVEEWNTKMGELGVTEDYATRLIDDFLYGTLQKFIGEVDKGIHPLSELEQGMRDLNLQFEDLIAGAHMLGATSEDLFRIEMLRADAMRQLEHSLKDPFYDSLRLEALKLSGGNVEHEQLMQSQRADRLSTEKQFGTDSEEYKALLIVQEAQRLDLAVRQAASFLEAAAQTAQQSAEAAEQAKAAAASAYMSFVDGLKSALDTAVNNIRQTVDAWANAAKSAFESAAKSYMSALEADLNAYKDIAGRMGQMRETFWTDTTLVDQPTAYKSARYQLDEQYARALAGDKDAAGELATTAKTFLDASFASQSDYSAYQADFHAVQAMLDTLESDAHRRAGEIQTELEALQAQLGEQGKTNKTLAELKEAMNVASAEYQRVAAEQATAYEKWGFTVVSLEEQYREAVAQWMDVQAFADQALLEGLIHQDQLSTQSIVAKLEELRVEFLLASALAAEAAAKAEQAAKAQAAADAALAEATSEQKQQAIRDKANEALEIINQHKPLDAGGVYGSRYKSDYDLLQAKADKMNEGKTLAPGQTTGSWTAASVKEDILSKGHTVAEWYELFGKAEGFTFTSEAALLAAKAAALNRGDTLGPGQTSGAWTASSVLADIQAKGHTIEEWYKLFGQAEGFASGGLATPGIALVGEKGPELVRFSSRAAVFPADITRNLLSGPAIGSDGGERADLALLREQLAETREQNRVLREILAQSRGVAVNTEKTAVNTNRTADNTRETADAGAIAAAGPFSGPPQKTEWAN